MAKEHAQFFSQAEQALLMQGYAEFQSLIKTPGTPQSVQKPGESAGKSRRQIKCVCGGHVRCFNNLLLFYFYFHNFIIALFIVMSESTHTIIMDMVKVKYKNILLNGNFRPYRPTSLF